MAAIRIADFDTWRPGYGGASVSVLLPGTSTLASIFTDEALTITTANPQTLSSLSVADIDYGKFAAPVYVGTAYELLINSIDTTGVQRLPLTTLAGEDASAATVEVTGGTRSNTLADILGRSVNVLDSEVFIAVGGVGASSSTNNATLMAAIGRAAAAGGGYVECPGGTYAVTNFTIPAGVVIRGVGRAGTTLQSTFAGSVATIGGARAGFSRLTLDGVTLVGGSVGIYAASKDQVVLDDVEVKRFETGIYRKGGALAAWRDLFLSNCTNGAKLYGEGTALLNNTWIGGKVDLCGTVGVDMRFVDAACSQMKLRGILFDTNTAKAVNVLGGRGITLRECWWTSNTDDLTIADQSSTNTVKDIEVADGSISGGTLTLSGTLDTVIFRRMNMANLTATLTSPQNNLLIEDCRETSVTIAGDATAWRRQKTTQESNASVTTTDATFTKAWAATLLPGQFVILSARIQARRRNGTDYEFAQAIGYAHRPGSLLAYDIQTGNFTVGNVLTGGTSGATARIVADNDGGATGTLTLYDITGTFVDDEIITDGSGGSASVNGTATAQNVTCQNATALAYDGQTVNWTVGEIVTGGTSGAKGRVTADVDGGATGTLTLIDVNGIFVDNEAITGSSGGAAVVNGDWTQSNLIAYSASNASYAATFIANGAQIEGRVRGVAGHTIEWIFDVDVVSNP